MEEDKYFLNLLEQLFGDDYCQVIEEIENIEEINLLDHKEVSNRE